MTAFDSDLTADQARALLLRAEQLGRSAENSAWPWIAFLLALGAVTSMGFLGFGATTMEGASQAGYLAVLIGMVVWILPLAAFAHHFARGARRGFGRRWAVYIGGWAAVYVGGLIAGLAYFEGNLAYWIPAAVSVGAVCLAAAVNEARR